MKAVIILPTYNEKGNVDRLIPVLENDIFPQIKNYDMSILVVDDNSPDGTAKEVRKLMKKWSNIDINFGKRHGLGAAYIRGMIYAIKKMNADVIFEMDADLQHDPEKIPQFLKKMDEGYDMVIGNRYSDGGSIPENWPLLRKLSSIVANIFVRTVFMKFSVHDWTGGYRALKKDVFLKEKEELTNYKGYIFQISFLHKAIRDGFRIGEVPFSFTDRTLGKSKIAPLEYINEVVRFVLSTRFQEIILGRFGKFLAVGSTGFIINAVLYLILIRTTPLSLAFANIVAAQFAIFSNYNFNNIWTFKATQAKSTTSYFKKMGMFYLTSNIGVWLIQSGTIQVGESLFGRKYPFFYFLVGTGLLLIWNFTAYSKVIWRRKSSK